MEMLRRLEPLALVMVSRRAQLGDFRPDRHHVLAEIFGTGTLIDVVYVVVGIAGLMFVPRLLDELHIGHGPHPRGV